MIKTVLVSGLVSTLVGGGFLATVGLKGTEAETAQVDPYVELVDFAYPNVNERVIGYAVNTVGRDHPGLVMDGLVFATDISLKSDIVRTYKKYMELEDVKELVEAYKDTPARNGLRLAHAEAAVKQRETLESVIASLEVDVLRIPKEVVSND